LGLPQEDTILALPAPVHAMRHARSTVLLGSLAVLRAAGKFDAYAALLPGPHRDILLNMVAGSWIPVEVAFSHYEACDGLGFSADQQAANGRSVFDRTSGTLLGTMIRMAREAGVSPWTVLPHFQRYWERGYDGGGVGVFRTGPKEARLEIVHVRLVDARYYRNALRGLITGIVELFCTKAYVVERPGARAPGTMTMRLQWA
jgi:hypothetical protein